MLEQLGQDQDSLEQYSSEVTMDDASETTGLLEQRRGVLLDDHHYFDDDEIDRIEDVPPRKRRLPPGISETQAKWIVDSDTEYSDISDDEEEMELDDTGSVHVQPEDGMDEDDMVTTEYGDTKSEMFMDLSPEDEAKE